MLGEAALTDADKAFMAFGEAFEKRFVKQDVHENRAIEQTLGVGWELLTKIPRAEIKRIKDEFIEKYLPKTDEEERPKRANRAETAKDIAERDRTEPRETERKEIERREGLRTDVGGGKAPRGDEGHDGRRGK